MSGQNMKTVTFISRHPPYGRDSALIGLDVVMASSVFDQHVNYVFVEDGVYQLLAGQDTTGIASRNLLKPLQALEIYGVENVFVDEEALRARNLCREDLAIETRPVSEDDLRRLVRDSDLVFSL